MQVLCERNYNESCRLHNTADRSAQLKVKITIMFILDFLDLVRGTTLDCYGALTYFRLD